LSVRRTLRGSSRAGHREPFQISHGFAPLVARAKEKSVAQKRNAGK